ncbi:hypothetical protein SDC9_81903 [bioreactor metagenome]|uniref:Uncharacterized protein n=1 Tax=bioreactor metagenome TaxID=1076179 RepID=A0A644Z9C8_9ZZZZ
MSFGISTSENEPITIKNWQGFVIGNQGSGLDYFGDYLEDPVLLTKNPLALAPAFLDWLLRFKSLLPTQDQNGGQNFFIDYQFTFHYPNEYLTIDNLSISNYYTENPLYLRSIKIENGENKYLIVNQNEKLNSGFGADYAFTNLPIALDPHYPTQIEFYLYGIGVMNAGNGPINWPYKFSVYIPNTLE